MIVEEYINDRIHRYSNQGVKLRQMETGILYDDAVDVPGLHTYEETDIPIEEDEPTADELLAILLGGAS